MKFRLNQQQFNQFKKALIVRTTPLLLLPMVAVLIFNNPGRATTIILIPIFLGLLVFVMWNSIKKQKKAWATYELTIGDTTIERTQAGFPDISISKSDIVEAIESSNGAITLVTKPKSNSVIVPFAVENKEELLRLIASFVTIRKAKNKYPLLIAYGGSILGLILFFSFMFATDAYLTTVFGSMLLVLCVWGFVATQRNKNVDRKVKRSSYVVFILVIVIISRIIMAWNQ